MTIDSVYDLTAPTLDDIENLAEDAFERLPRKFRERCGDIIFQIEDFPDDEVSADLELETPYDILGLFQGVAITELSQSDQPSGEPNVIYLYRRPILDEWAETQITLGDIVTHVIIHEIGHHFGLSDEDIERIEAEVMDDE